MDYATLYQRNIGIFTHKEQNKLRNAKVMIAGTGGIGGIQAVTLARMGIGEITIMDPGIFDAPDMNRQYGAMVSTLGQNKAIATGKILQDIAPYAQIDIIAKKLDKKELKKFIQNSNVVIDAIDLADFEYKSMFSRIARAEGKYNLTCPIPDLGAILMILDPDGMTFEEFTANKSYPPITSSAKEKYKQRIQSKTEYKKNNEIPFLASIASNSGAAALSGGMLAIEAALIITGKRKKNDIVTIPFVTYLDFFARTLRIFNPFDEL